MIPNIRICVNGIGVSSGETVCVSKPEASIRAIVKIIDTTTTKTTKLKYVLQINNNFVKEKIVGLHKGFVKINLGKHCFEDSLNLIFQLYDIEDYLLSYYPITLLKQNYCTDLQKLLKDGIQKDSWIDS